MKFLIKVVSITFITLFCILFLNNNYTLGASSPYVVPSSVKNNWSNIPGGKEYSETTGRKLVYDVYSKKTISGGYRIVNRNFGKGTQPYINFDGWAILFGHKKHTYANNETYIVARKQGSTETKIYATLKEQSLSATKDLEYNKRDGDEGLYNECPEGTTNKPNSTCNMRYNNIDFQAYLPIQELFPDPTEAATWNLYIVKKVDNRIVYDELILPFEFNSLSYKGGNIKLSSGINANKLIMNNEGVLRRRYVKQTAQSVAAELGEDRYFTPGRTYTRVASNEAYTVVFYGVRSPHDGNETKYASSAYWLFGGDQAKLSFEPEDIPPEHREHGITNHRYKNGNTYWIQPGDSVNIRLRGYDKDSLLNRTALRLDDNNANVDSRFRFYYGNNSYENYSGKTSHITLNSASRTYQNSAQTIREATFNVTPKTHGHNYNVFVWHTDNAGNSVGWIDTQMNLGVDGEAPTVQFRNKADTANFTGREWSNDKIEVRLKFSDAHSGVKRSRYAWTESKSTPTSSQWSSWSTSTNFVVSQDKAGQWYLHVQTEDNVGNIRTTNTGVFKLNNPPVADFTYEGYPNPLFEGDLFHLINTSTDEDGHNMTATWTITDPDGITKTYSGTLKDPHGSKIINGNWHVKIHDLTNPDKPLPKAGDYTIRLEITDEYNGKDEITKTIYINPLIIIGQVSHTDRWKQIHDSLGNPEDVFFSGERFILTSTTTNNSIDEDKDVDVEVTFKGIDINDIPVEIVESLVEDSRTAASITHKGEIYEEYMSEPHTILKSNTVMYFDFKATWSNGVIKHDIVPITIVDTVYDFYKLHKTN